MSRNCCDCKSRDVLIDKAPCVTCVNQCNFQSLYAISLPEEVEDMSDTYTDVTPNCTQKKLFYGMDGGYTVMHFNPMGDTA